MKSLPSDGTDSDRLDFHLQTLFRFVIHFHSQQLRHKCTPSKGAERMCAQLAPYGNDASDHLSLRIGYDSKSISFHHILASIAHLQEHLTWTTPSLARTPSPYTAFPHPRSWKVLE
jgi:hypothetical protein